MITSIVRNLLRPNTQSVYYLPLDLLVKHKISQQDFINFSKHNLKSKQNSIKDLTYDLATRAFQHLNSARALTTKVPNEAKLLFSSSFMCEVYLNNLEAYDFDLMNPKLNNDFRVWIAYKLLLAKFRKTF